MNKVFTILLFITSFSFAQTINSFADSIRVKYNIPELAFAVISSDSIYHLQVSGVQRMNTNYSANVNDKFRIGSNTKIITGFIAAQLVKHGKIKWTTKFFDLYPEFKTSSKKTHHNLTLLNLLSFRSKLYQYTYTYSEPTKEQFSGNEDAQRYQFAKWFLQQEPINSTDSINFSNLAYIAAGLMLEKASGKSYKSLVTDLGKELNIDFGFGAPNSTDTLQPWGHDNHLAPEPPGDNYKLNWLLPAGNIHVSLPDFIKFTQLQLKGLKGESSILTKKEFEFLFSGLTRVSVGWFYGHDESGKTFYYHIGNPGTFTSKIYVYQNTNRAYIFFANSQSARTDNGMSLLFEELKKKYN
ncbi:MAG: beta-lactamase [Bacteroidetes bacterium]|jgi:CubicO group peptidase (beta-lactamase class C family)|nr:beta-lactamase [Bacteroidota bacterium]